MSTPTDPTRDLALRDAIEHNMTDEEYVTAVEKCRLTIPPDFKSEFTSFENYRLSQRNCLYLGKGPSLEQAGDELGKHGVVATVNEACLKVVELGHTVDYAFFTDAIALRNCQRVWESIGTFVCTAMVHGDGIDDPPVPLDRVLGNAPSVVVTHDSQLPWDDP